MQAMEGLQSGGLLILLIVFCWFGAYAENKEQEEKSL